jgi:hypothetical protein
MSRLSMQDAKDLARSDLSKAAGQEFECYGLDGQPNGVIGTILPELSSRLKIQATLTCLTEGCTETHVREISDWHQSRNCLTHSKTKAKGTSGRKGNRYLTVDGVKHTWYPIADSDTPEMVAQKQENNAAFEKLELARDLQLEADKAAKAEARKAKLAEDREVKAKAAEAKKLEAIRKNAELTAKVAAEKGVGVSAR